MSNLPHIPRIANDLDLSQIAGGALQEKINIEMDKVARNLNDPNTDFKTKRKLVIELSFTTDAEREITQVETGVKTTLAALKGVNTKMLLGSDPEGRPILKEFINQGAKMSGSHDIIEHDSGSSSNGFNQFKK